MSPLSTNLLSRFRDGSTEEPSPVVPVKWRSGLRDLPNAVLATRECGNSWDSSLGRCIEVIQTVTDPLTRFSDAIQYGRSPEAMNSRPRGQLASVSSTQSNRLMSLKDEIPPVEVSPLAGITIFRLPPYLLQPSSTVRVQHTSTNGDSGHSSLRLPYPYTP
jgi:hypothetical protein